MKASVDKVSEDVDENEANRRTGCGSCKCCFKSPSFFMYVTYLLSRWGDRMWQFAIGLYLVQLSDKTSNQLLLAAVFGFTCCGLIILFGSLIGDWVDRNGRLKVVRVSLLTQNLSVVACCAALYARLTYVEFQWRHLLVICFITLAVIAQLASVAYKIAIERDWIVVIASGNKSLLANLNAVIRSMDLACKIISPAVVGLIMKFSSQHVSAVVIAAWNVFSLVAEYAILSYIYRLVPALAVKQTIKNDVSKEEAVNMKQETAGDVQTTEINNELMNSTRTHDVDVDVNHTVSDDVKVDDDAINNMTEMETDALKAQQAAAAAAADKSEVITSVGDKMSCGRVCRKLLPLVTGWRTYARQSVVFAGVSLAFLYMTVLAFDSITIGFIYMNGVSELVVGVCLGLAGATGIMGTFFFTRLRKRLGLERTGIIAFAAEASCLTLAVASVWAPGSPFDLRYNPSSEPVVCNASVLLSSANSTSSNTSITDHTLCDGSHNGSQDDVHGVNISVILLLVGIISSRIGLWMADLVVTQTMQESVVETERGIVGGVQFSTNMLMDLLKFALVIALPHIQTFGIHVILSFLFIVSAGLLFSYHAWRVRRQHRKPSRNLSQSRL